jgi:glycosyltransferase involved in cell wall biosynthesis
MKILITATTFPRYANDTIPQFLLGFSRALVKAGAEVTVVAPHDTDTNDCDNYDGVEVRRIHYWMPKSAHGLCYGAGIPTNIRRRKWLALQFPTLEMAFFQAALRYGRDADILNPHWTFAGLPTALAGTVLKKPVITHAYTAEYIPKVLKAINRFIVNRSEALISISQYAADMVEEVVQPKAHHIIGYGVNPEKIAPADFDSAAFRKAHGIAEDELFVFAVGRLVERKGYRVLIEAVARLANRGVPVRLFHGGNGPLRDQLQLKIHSLGVMDKIKLLGFIPDEELAYFVKSADMLVMPSVMDDTGDTEGLGIPLLEAMANGTVAIGSRIGGILSIIEHEQNGLLVEAENPEDLANAIERVGRDKALREKLIRGGYSTIRSRYDWGNIAQETLGLFEHHIREYRHSHEIR